jgi:nitrate reductase assembly molybdenum cofactor insertion protein NarJ
MKTRQQYSALAHLFAYPGEEYISNVNGCAATLKENYPEAYVKLEPFIAWVNSHEIHDIEELFGKTFHIQAICYLDMGYVLFAEDYKRGEFLVQMKREQANAGIDCGEELADNLPNVMRLMAVMTDEVFLREFAVRVVKVALEKMIKEFDESRIQLKDKVRKKKQKVIIMEDLQNRNIYQFALEAMYSVVEKDFQDATKDPEIVPTIGVDALNCSSGCSTPQPSVDVLSAPTAVQ